MKKLLVLLVFVMCATSCWARSIPGAPNEIDDPYFEQLPGSWYTSGSYTLFPNVPGQGNYIDPGRDIGAELFLRDVVDDALSPTWNPDWSMKEIDLSFFAHVAGDGYVMFRFDWWNDPQIPQPSDDPADPGSPPPDGITPWYLITATSMDQGVVIDNSLLAPGEVAPNNWDLYVFHEIWDIQPRWVSIEFQLGVDPEIAGTLADPAGSGEALLTGVDFEAQCLPEPGAMLLFAFGGIWWVIRRTKS